MQESLRASIQCCSISQTRVPGKRASGPACYETDQCGVIWLFAGYHRLSGWHNGLQALCRISRAWNAYLAHDVSQNVACARDLGLLSAGVLCASLYELETTIQTTADVEMWLWIKTTFCRVPLSHPLLHSLCNGLFLTCRLNVCAQNPLGDSVNNFMSLNVE